MNKAQKRTGRDSWETQLHIFYVLGAQERDVLGAQERDVLGAQERDVLGAQERDVSFYTEWAYKHFVIIVAVHKMDFEDVE